MLNIYPQQGGRVRIPRRYPVNSENIPLEEERPELTWIYYHDKEQDQAGLACEKAFDACIAAQLAGNHAEAKLWRNVFEKEMKAARFPAMHRDMLRQLDTVNWARERAIEAARRKDWLGVVA